MSIKNTPKRRILPSADTSADEKQAAVLSTSSLMRGNISAERLARAAVMATQDQNLIAEDIDVKINRIIRRNNGVDFSELGEHIIPLTAPGLIGPGLDLITKAKSLGDDSVYAGKGSKLRVERAGAVLTGLVRGYLYSNGGDRCNTTIRGNQTKPLAVVSGHKWEEPLPAAGPVPAKVMVVGKMLNHTEKNSRRILCGESGHLLRSVCLEMGIADSGDWYVTALLKTENPLADSGGSTLKASWVNEWLLFLQQEIRLVQPRFILCLGADALKAVLGKRSTLGSMEGRAVEYRYPLAQTADEKQVFSTALVMSCLHPGYVLHSPEHMEVFKNSISRFSQLLRGYRPDIEEADLDHFEVRTLDDLIELEQRIDYECEDNLIAIDAEWHGEHPQNNNSYLRSIQLSWKSKTACYIHVHNPGGEWGFDGTQKEMCEILARIVEKRRIAGHFFAADLEWLVAFGADYGFDLRKQFCVAKTWTEYRDNSLNGDESFGGYDTGLALHAINETGDFSLTAATLRHTSAPRYDIAVTKWRDDYCNKHKIKKEELEGYGECPNELLVPYAQFDADCTRRLVIATQQLLNGDQYGNDSWLPFWSSMRVLPAALEMSIRGITVDRDKIDHLTEKYLSARESLAQKIRDWARWPELNLNSPFHVREFLFGEELNGKVTLNIDDPPIRLRPKNARSLKIQPVLTTDKRPMPWQEVIENKLIKTKTPSTNKTSLSILAQENQEVRKFNLSSKKIQIYDFSEYINWVRDYRFISQILKSVLRPPVVDDDTGQYVRKEGHYVYKFGLPASICDDVRVRTHFYQTKETGRWSTARPPLQNLAERRESDYKRILGDEYTFPLRSILCADPGYLLLSIDYKGAELLAMAILSGDPVLMDHVLRNQLPENDSNFYDIHSSIAVLAFQLDCPPTKGGLESIGKKHLRIVAKSVIFGYAYGRAAKAIALAAKEEGVKISISDAQQLINTISATYRGLPVLFAQCRARVTNPGWLSGVFGRYRRFPQISEPSVLGDFERQAMNFPIQNLVAEAINIALFNLTEQREKRKLTFSLVMQLHDAVQLLVPYQEVVEVVDEVIPQSFCRDVPIYPANLDGKRISGGPFQFGADIESYQWWGIKMQPDDCLSIDLPPYIAGWRWNELLGGYEHSDKLNKVWRGSAAGGQLFPVDA